ncbi:right-handed parallel beta-helix repeat-containing protein, partial [Pseudonocardia bannensis]
GGWGDERLSVTECTATGNGTNGIFVELQREAWPPPRGISITGCHVTDNRFGISDWGAQGLVVSACTITGNHQVGFDVSSRGTATVGGRGGLVTGCLIDLNVGDGVAIGGTPGPYTVQGNRISGNGGHGYRVHDIGCAEPVTAQEVVIEGNGIRDNALDGVRLDGATCDAFVVGNRIRNNGRRAAPAACGGGPNVRYTALSMIDQGAAWLPDGHRGKILTAGDETAVVTANSGTGLMLAPVRPGASSAWAGDPPAGGTPYRLPDPPSTRAGITVNATAVSPTLRANRSWDNQQTRSQTHGLWITADGRCTDGRVVDNDLEGNAVGAARFDTAPAEGLWERNHGLPARRGDGPTPAPIGQPATGPSGPGSSGC